MNRYLISILLLFYSLHFAAQTFEVPFISQPDTLVKTMLTFHDAGAAGRDLTWDFKSLSPGEDYPVCLSFPYATDSAKFHVTEHHTRYCRHISGDSLFSDSFENATTSVLYHKAELCLKRQMNFGDTLIGEFSGTGEYCHRLPLSVSGVTKTVVDAYGTLILPEDTLSDVFRLHTTRCYHEVFSDTINLETHWWQWYSPQYPYPVFESMRTVRVNPLVSSSDTVVYSTSFLFSPVEQEKGDINSRRKVNNSISDDASYRVNKSFSDEASIFVEVRFAPNPVRDNLQIYCVLSGNAAVSVQIFSASGIKIYHDVFNLSAGHNSLSIPMSTQISGAYTLYVSTNDVIFEDVFIKQ